MNLTPSAGGGARAATGGAAAAAGGQGRGTAPASAAEGLGTLAWGLGLREREGPATDLRPLESCLHWNHAYSQKYHNFIKYINIILSNINNTTFNTTVNNTLIITAQWNTTNAGNSILSRNFTLTKVY